jgi:hypothetical protein
MTKRSSSGFKSSEGGLGVCVGVTSEPPRLLAADLALGERTVDASCDTTEPGGLVERRDTTEGCLEATEADLATSEGCLLATDGSLVTEEGALLTTEGSFSLGAGSGISARPRTAA